MKTVSVEETTAAYVQYRTDIEAVENYVSGRAVKGTGRMLLSMPAGMETGGESFISALSNRSRSRSWNDSMPAQIVNLAQTGLQALAGIIAGDSKDTPINLSNSATTSFSPALSIPVPSGVEGGTPAPSWNVRPRKNLTSTLQGIAKIVMGSDSGSHDEAREINNLEQPHVFPANDSALPSMDSSTLSDEKRAIALKQERKRLSGLNVPLSDQNLEESAKEDILEDMYGAQREAGKGQRHEDVAGKPSLSLERSGSSSILRGAMSPTISVDLTEGESDVRIQRGNHCYDDVNGLNDENDSSLLVIEEMAPSTQIKKNNLHRASSLDGEMESNSIRSEVKNRKRTRMDVVSYGGSRNPTFQGTQEYRENIIIGRGDDHGEVNDRDGDDVDENSNSDKGENDSILDDSIDDGGRGCVVSTYSQTHAAPLVGSPRHHHYHHHHHRDTSVIERDTRTVPVSLPPMAIPNVIDLCEEDSIVSSPVLSHRSLGTLTRKRKSFEQDPPSVVEAPSPSLKVVVEGVEGRVEEDDHEEEKVVIVHRSDDKKGQDRRDEDGDVEFVGVGVGDCIMLDVSEEE